MKSSSTLFSSLTGAVLFLIAFISLTVTGLGSAEVVLRQCLAESDTNDGIYARRYINVLNARNADVLLGDSQFLYAFDNSVEFTNLAYQGESPELLLLLAKNYFRHIDPGRVVLLAGHQLFAAGRAEKGSEGYESYFLQLNRVQHWVGFQALTFEPGLIGLIDKWIRNPSRFPDCFAAGPAATGDTAGEAASAWVGKTAGERQTLMQGRLDRQRPIDAYRTSSQFIAYEHLVDFLHSRGANLCMVRPPLTSSYEEMVMTDALSKEAIAALRDIAASRRIKFIDSGDLEETFPDDLFVNQDHLNAEGARIFTPAVISACFAD